VDAEEWSEYNTPVKPVTENRSGAWVVRVYKGSKLIKRWHIYDRTEHEASREAEADVEREHPGCDWTLTPSSHTENPLSIGAQERRRVTEADDVDPEEYIQRLPSSFNADEAMRQIQDDTAWCMDNPQERALFIRWIKDHENLFPDVAKAMEVISQNDSWCTDSDEDMEAFFAAIGFEQTDPNCPRCGGSGEEPGAPRDEDAEGNELMAQCQRCRGSGQRLNQCECDNTHQANNTVCRWCCARGRRHFNDPAV